MSETATAETIMDSASVADDSHDDGKKHFGDKDYIKIAVVLAVITLAEIFWPEFVDAGPMQMWPLLLMMVAKFIIIASYFMHLKFDNKVLTRVFYAGLILAVGVYVVTLFTFRIFGN